MHFSRREKQTTFVVIGGLRVRSFVNAHANASSGVSGLKFGLSLYLYPYFVYASSECFSGTAFLCRLA